MKPSDLARYVFLALTWGLSFLVLVRVVDALGWAAAVSIRSLVAGVTLWLTARFSGRRLDLSGGWAPFLVIGATTVAGQLVALSWGTPRTGTAISAILVAAIPLFSMLIGHVWGHEAITGRGIMGLAAGSLGIVLLVGFPAVPVTAELLAGSGAVLLASFFAAFGSNYFSRRLGNGAGPDALSATTGAFLAGGVMTLPLLLLVPPPNLPDLSDLGWLFVLGAGMSGLAYVVYFGLVQSIGATRAITVEFAVTIVAVATGALLAGETLTPVQWTGGAIVLLGCMIVTGVIGRPTPRTSP